jgi:lipoate-protein ligase A
MNMAVDEAVALTGGPPTLRFYTWGSPTLTIGAFQPLSQIRLDRCRELGIPVVRRITGGRALLHSQDLTYSVACTVPSPFFPSHLRGCYRAIAEALCLGFRQLEVQAEIVPCAPARRSRPYTPDCFSTHSLHELTVNGRKVVGSAQRRWRGTFLQQGSVSISTDRDLEMELIMGVNGTAEPHSTRVSPPLHSVPSIAELQKVLASGFRKRLGITLVEGGLLPEERECAERLLRTRYNNPAWLERLL